MQVKRLKGLVLSAVSVVALGCGADGPHGHEHEPAGKPATAGSHDHDHGARAKGPRGGHLIELGDDAFSVELVLDDDRHAVTVYLLDSAAAAAAVGDGPEVRIQLFEDGQFVDYALSPADPAGDTPAFSLVDEKLHRAFDAGHVRGRLRVTVGAKEHSATLDDLCDIHEHDDHDGHDHG